MRRGLQDNKEVDVKYFLKVIIYTIVFAILMSACTSVNKPENGQQGTVASGGVSLVAENINLKEIGVSQRQGDSYVTFSFLSGSRKTGYAEKKLTQLPKYEITLLDRPQRIKLKFHNISFWDYELTDTRALPDYIAGIFREVPAKDDSLIIYIQLTKNVSFMLEEDEGSLTVKVIPLSVNEGTRYFCIANAFLEHQEGRWPGNLEMQPVLCADLSNTLLISSPFDDREEAYAFMKNASALLEKSLPEKTLNVVALSGGALPEYLIDINYSLLEKRPVVQKNGAVANTPLLLNNGRYLCTASDGRIAFARSNFPDEHSIIDSYAMSETLWIRYQNDRIQSVDVPEFFSIKKAAFSSDGRYLGILDVSLDNSVLYVYDFDTLILYNLGEEGFGSLTSDFAWSDIDNTVYAASASMDVKILSCSFSGDIISIGVAEERPFGEGSLAVSKGRIFFADSEKDKVYLLGETSHEITKGTDIQVSPDGKMLLVLEKETSKTEQVLTSLKLYDIETREETVIVRRAEITSFSFSQSGGKVYYTIDSDEGEQFGYALFVYDTLSGSLTKAALCRTARFFAAAAPATLYFVDYVDDNAGNGFFATYIYDVSS